MTRTVELALDAKAALGESPRWHVGERALYWVDISEQRLHRFDPADGATRTRAFDQPVGCFAFRAGGGFVLAMRDGFGLIDSFGGEVRPYGRAVEAGRATRFNDGRTDAQGRFYAGTIDLAKQRSLGALYRLDPDGTVTRLADGALTSNGAAFSPDGRTFTWADTPRHVLYAFDHDGAGGALAHRRVLHQWPEGNGRPDGGSFDREGDYWTALFAGGRVARLNALVEIVEEVPIPCPKPTMIAFGGADLRTAYVTTAREGLSAAELDAFPKSGGLFTFRVETPGLPEYPFGA